jgi:hypothetical protein
MKKLILAIAATSVAALSGQAQQIQFADNSNNSYDISIGATPDQTEDLNLALLVGSTSGTITTDVVTLLLNGTTTATTALGSVQSAVGDIAHAGGTITDLSFNAYNLPAGTYFAEVEAWTGNYSSYAAAEASGVTGEFAGVSSIFTTSTAAPPAPPADISSITPFSISQVPTTVVPEPTTLAMAGVGLASILIFRRKSK